MEAPERALFLRILDSLDFESSAGLDGWGDVAGFPTRALVCGDEVVVRFTVGGLGGATMPWTDHRAEPTPLTWALESGLVTLELYESSIQASFANICDELIEDGPQIVVALAEGLKRAGNEPPKACMGCNAADGLSLVPEGKKWVERLCPRCREEKERAFHADEIAPSGVFSGAGAAWGRDVGLCLGAWVGFWLALTVLLEVTGFDGVPRSWSLVAVVLLNVFSGGRLGRSSRRWRGIERGPYWAIGGSLLVGLIGTTVVAAVVDLVAGAEPTADPGAVVGFVVAQDEEVWLVLLVQLVSLATVSFYGAKKVE